MHVVHEQIHALYQAFLDLPETEQTLITVLAVIYKPIGNSKLDAVVNVLHQRDILPQAKARYRITTARKKELHAQSLIVNSKHGLTANKLLANKLIDEIDQLPTNYTMSAQNKLLEIIMAAEEVVPISDPYDWQNKALNEQRVVRDLLLLGKTEQLEYVMEFNKNPQIIDHAQNRVLVDTLFLPFELQRIFKLSTNLQYQAFATAIRVEQMQGNDCAVVVAQLEQTCAAKHATGSAKPTTAGKSNAEPVDPCVYLLAEQYLYQLRFDDFEALLDPQDPSTYALQLWATYQFLQGNNALALDYYEKAIKTKNKLAKRKNQYLHEVLGYFYKLALMIKANQEDVGGYDQALQQIEFEQNDRKVNSDFETLSASLSKPIKCLANGEQLHVNIAYTTKSEEADFFCHHLSYFNYLLAQLWCNTDIDAQKAQQALAHKDKFLQLNYPLFAALCEQVACSINKQEWSHNSALGDSALRSNAQSNNALSNIAEQIQSKAQWDVALDKLIALAGNKDSSKEIPASATLKPVRLIWELRLGFPASLQAREQKLNKTGWSKGRVVSLKRLYNEPTAFDYLSSTDIAICRAIEAYQGYSYYASTEYVLQGLPALQAAVGIDNLYFEGELESPIEIIQREPELEVSQQGDQLCLSIPDLTDSIAEYAKDRHDDPYLHEQNYDFKLLSQDQCQLTVFSDEHLKVASVIGENGLLIPVSAKQKALSGISAIAPLLNIRSDIAELDTGLETQACDPHLVINIEPNQAGLAFSCVVMPFGEDGPAFTPGVGNASLTTEVKGKRVATQRKLIREQSLLDQLDSACPAFLGMPGNILALEDTQEALSALEQLEAATALEDFDLLLRWPKGKKISLSKKLESQHLQLALSKKHEWFELTGELAVDDGQVVAFRRLLELVSTSNGRFVALDTDKILVLSESLRNKLAQLSQVTDDGKFHPLASLQVEQASAGMRMKTLHAWDEQTKKMREANNITPQLPSTFQGQLRDYQLAGFDWALRLAHWGAGACLADDMGLGKTMQGLAVLLSRAPNGPSLVIAPTSVCFNWQQEALKFTPTLNIKLFADASTTALRKDLLDNLQPFDCVIISYGLLLRESNMLQQVQWHSIIADEAQALKNPLAKRTKAAYALKGDFKMITTGTPIENDLTELWSLFRFINPGLLGNLKTFAKRFALPMENAKEDRLAAHAASQALKAMIQPFMLRRMKNQVLTELPSRTNINIPVEMSADEQAFYEALRLNALDNISQGTEKAKSSNLGEQRIRMLAELVKLRQACCHPKLVMAESLIPSAKLAALDVLLTELMLNKHKALIFSQFVGHLKIIEQHVKAKGLRYQYLDGSTSQKERQKRVNAFQAGEGDVFLISLKAGGSGLNLTAADYVIHMDPWWNPAVEEQASDRAHRMGQTRPVTIYRLITQNTIEEKIVALHQHKRDLADKLLSGNESVSKLSVDDMLNLLKKTF